MTYPVRVVVPNAFDALRDRIVAIAASGQDFFQEACAFGLEITDIDSHIRFCIGDVASLIETAYGSDRMGEFAGSTKRSKKTCYQYAAVSRFYPIEERASWLAEPALSWSHLRLAMRLKNADDAAVFLIYCADNALSVDRASIEIKERLGETIEPAALFNGKVVFERVNGAWIIRGIDYTEIRDGHSYAVTIRRLP